MRFGHSAMSAGMSGLLELADRIGHLREHDWRSWTVLPQRDGHGRAVGQDQIGCHGEQLSRVVAEYISVPGPAILDREVASLEQFGPGTNRSLVPGQSRVPELIGDGISSQGEPTQNFRRARI